MDNLLLGLVILLVIYLLMRVFSTKVYRFYRPTCGYCKISQSEWDAFKKAMTYRMVSCHDVNLDNDSQYNKHLAQKYAVSGVPTVIAVTALGNSVLYTGERTMSAMNNWVDQL
jgi:glutaredoxin